MNAMEQMSTIGMAAPAIVAHGLSKRYGQSVALENVDLTLAAGATLALIGHNGAGKTTLMKLILGLIRPSAGTLNVLGAEPGAAPLEHRRLVGFLPENVAFHDELSGAQTLRFYARLKGAMPAQCDALLERVGLGFAADRRVKTYSKGMRQRLGLAQALLGEPRLMLLDEPTTGLDPASRGEFFRIMRELSERGATVIISSHILTELEARTDLVAIMNRGRLAAFGPLEALRRRADLPAKLTVTAPRGTAVILTSLGDLVLGHKLAEDGRSLELLCRVDDKMEAVRRLASLGAAVANLDISHPGLDDIYRHFSPAPPEES